MSAAGRAEQAWQLRVALAIAKNGDKPITRQLLAPLIAEELPWRKYLNGYAKKWSTRTGGPLAPARAKAAKPARKSAK